MEEEVEKIGYFEYLKKYYRKKIIFYVCLGVFLGFIVFIYNAIYLKKNFDSLFMRTAFTIVAPLLIFHFKPLMEYPVSPTVYKKISCFDSKTLEPIRCGYKTNKELSTEDDFIEYLQCFAHKIGVTVNENAVYYFFINNSSHLVLGYIFETGRDLPSKELHFVFKKASQNYIKIN